MFFCSLKLRSFCSAPVEQGMVWPRYTRIRTASLVVQNFHREARGRRLQPMGRILASAAMHPGVLSKFDCLG